MARGFGAKETTVALAPERLGSMPKGKALKEGVALILSDPKVKADFLRFTKGMALYVSNAGGFSDEVKAKMDEIERQQPNEPIANRLGTLKKLGKLELIETLKRLPASIRNLIEVDKSSIAKMFRGVKDREIKEVGDWKNGQFVYGFTTDKKVAKEFSGGGRSGMTDHTGVISGATDVESVGGIIDPRRFAAVFEAVFEKIPESEHFDGWLDAKYYGGKEYYEKEKEYIAYDVKLRKDGDKYYTPKGR